MIDLHDILIEPVLSESATALREQGKYVFRVAPAATKLQIKDAVAKLFNVKVVRLAPGETIKVFEGV